MWENRTHKVAVFQHVSPNTGRYADALSLNASFKNSFGNCKGKIFVWVKQQLTENTRLRQNMHMDLLNLSTLNKLNETEQWATVATVATAYSLPSVATTP